MTQAKEFVVGDRKGWTINFDYQAWAEGKDFRVGDKLGSDEIVLATPGRKWYICGCETADKSSSLQYVQPQSSSSPAMAPSPVQSNMAVKDTIEAAKSGKWKTHAMDAGVGKKKCTGAISIANIFFSISKLVLINSL
ncbi:hypothetical protein QYF36_015550 [Acer negundo]|nr:hypothetical protein QYF36_015550 [Acer negundo]